MASLPRALCKTKMAVGAANYSSERLKEVTRTTAEAAGAGFHQEM